MRTAAILPVKRFAFAKQRLGESVADGLRLQLARAMVTDVLCALAEAESIELTILVTRERDVAQTARDLGALVVEDEVESGQSAAASAGVRRALAEGIERVLCVPGDCPALDPAELDALLDAADAEPAGPGAPAVLVVPDRHGTGTNGLLLTPPDAIAPAFGPGSCARHQALARAAGIAARVERPASLLLDIDTGADLAALRERLASTHVSLPAERAVRTRAVLDRHGQPDALTATSTS